MLIGALIGLALVTTASFEPGDLTPERQPSAGVQMSTQQKDAAMRPLVRRATDCLTQTVTGDARYAASLRAGDVNELIVDAMAPCLPPVRAMIDGYDRLYGDGAGEAFFIGPYLDGLPTIITRRIQGASE